MSTISPETRIAIEGGVRQHRHLVTDLPGPLSVQAHQRRVAAVTAAVSSTVPIYTAAAGGGVIVDLDGNHHIDLAAGIGVVGVGNSAEEVVRRLTEQAHAFTHTGFSVAPYLGYVEVCEWLNRITPGAHEKRTALFNSGAEAVENAVKVARAATGRPGIVVLEYGYHGRTNLTLAMTTKGQPFKTGFGPFASEVYRVPSSYPYRDGLDGPQAAARTIASIKEQLDLRHLAAIVAEPVMGEGGFIVPAPGYLNALLDFAHEHGAVFIADEIQSGIGRTGAWFASEHEDLVPDLVAIGKGVGGGLPLSAVTGRAELMDAVTPGGLGGTYAGNPVACAAAIGALNTVQDRGLLAAAATLGRLAASAFARDLDGVAAVGDIRGRGAMVALEFVDPLTGRPDPALAVAVAKRCHRAGVIVLTCGYFGNVIRLLPPLVIPPKLFTEALGVLTDAVLAETANRDLIAGTVR